MSFSANVVALRPTDEPSDRLAALLERRSELESELKVVGAPESTRTAAAAALAEAEGDLAAIDAAERAAWVAWAEDPTDEQPTPRHHDRRQLEQRRALAAADLRAADAAVASVQGRVNQLGVEIRGLAPAIYECRLESVMAQVPEIEKFSTRTDKCIRSLPDCAVFIPRSARKKQQHQVAATKHLQYASKQRSALWRA